LRPPPRRPVTQKAQSTAHPVWEERHTVKWPTGEVEGRESSVGSGELETARASVPFPIELPSELPAGFGLASVELVDAGYGAGVTLYLRDEDADAGIGTIRLHLEAASELPPATSADQSSVDIGVLPGRFTPDRSQLEWIDSGLYRSLDAPGLALDELLAIATSIGAEGTGG